MAGFRRLCGRFRCVGRAMTHGGTEGAKFKRLRRLWGFVPVVGRVGERQSCASMRTGDPADGIGVKSAVKWRWLRPAQGVANRGWGSGSNCARFVLKMGLDIQLGIQLGTLRRIGKHPHRLKKIAQNSDF